MGRTQRSCLRACEALVSAVLLPRALGEKKTALQSAAFSGGGAITCWYRPIRLQRGGFERDLLL